MRKKMLENPYTRRLIVYYVRGMAGTLEISREIVNYFDRGWLNSQEAEYMLEHLPQIKKWKLN